MNKPAVLRQNCLNANCQQSSCRTGGSVTTLFSKERGSNEPGDELERLQNDLEAAALFVFQQRLVIYRLTGGVHFPGEADLSMQVCSSNAADYKAAMKRLVDLEDNLSQAAQQYISVSNIKALNLLNEKQFSRALQLLQRADVIVQKNSGRLFCFNTEFSVKRSNELAQYGGRSLSGGSEECHVQETLVSFFTKRHETVRQLALAVIENNIGLYHFKIAEYELAAQHISRALQLEEVHAVKTIGVTYFNLAQTLYELGSIEDAFSAIDLAENAIENQLHECQSPRSYLSRSEHQCAAVPATTVTGLEKKSFFMNISWREAVCMLSRVLEAHGGWLQNKGDYKAAIHFYEKSDSWLSSLGWLSGEERLRRRELRRRVQECRRYHRHSRRVPKAPSGTLSGSGCISSGPPRSVIVTTALHPGIEETTRALSFEDNKINGNKKKDAVGPRKPRYTDANEALAIAGGGSNDFTDRRLQSEFPCAPQSRGAAVARHRLLWNSNTNVNGGNTTRGPTISLSSSSRLFLAYGAPSRRTSGTATRHFLGREREPRIFSEPPAFFCSAEATAVSMDEVQRSRCVGHNAPTMRNNYASVRRLSSSSVGDEEFSFLPFGEVRVLSFARCIYTLQAFFRARISLVKKEWRQVFMGLKLILSTSQISPHLSHFSSFALLLNRKIHEKKENILARETLGCTNLPFNVCDVILAFLAARRSMSLVQQRYVGRRYTDIMRKVQSPSFTAGKSRTLLLNEKNMMTKTNGSVQKRAWGEYVHRQEEIHTSNEPSDDPEIQVNEPANDNSPPRHSCKGGFSTSVFRSCKNTNAVGTTEEGSHRQYNSVLRMFSQGGNIHRYSDITVSEITGVVNEHPYGRSESSLTDAAAGIRVNPRLMATPRTFGDTGIYGVGVDRSILSRKKIVTPASSSATCKKVGCLFDVSVDSHSCFGPQGETVAATENGTCDVWNESDSCCARDRLPLPRRLVAHQRPSFLLPRSGARSVTCTSAGIIRRRIVREGAAIIIQTAWRNWRARRYFEAVKKHSVSS